MPIYEYACRDCESQFELLIRGSEVAKCPTCHGERLEKQFSVPAAHIAGSNRLPVCEAPLAGPCGRPECGTGGCQMQ